MYENSLEFDLFKTTYSKKYLRFDLKTFDNKNYKSSITISSIITMLHQNVYAKLGGFKLVRIYYLNSILVFTNLTLYSS